MESSTNDNKKLMLTINILSYILVAVGLFLALFKRKVVPQDCTGGTCVDIIGGTTYKQLVSPIIGWSIFGVGIVIIVILTILKGKKN